MDPETSVLVERCGEGHCFCLELCNVKVKTGRVEGMSGKVEERQDRLREIIQKTLQKDDTPYILLSHNVEKMRQKDADTQTGDINVQTYKEVGVKESMTEKSLIMGKGWGGKKG